MSEESLLDYFREDFTLLIEAGFVAVKHDTSPARVARRGGELICSARNILTPPSAPVRPRPCRESRSSS